MAARRNNPPPLEVMRGRVDAGSEARSEPVHEERRVGAAPTTPPEPKGLWAKLRYPVVFRVPQGYLILASMLGFCLLVAAFLVGVAQGRAEQRREQIELQRQVRLFGPEGLGGARGVESEAATDGGRLDPSQARPIEPKDPREPGRNYFVLARYPRPHAQRLIRFLARHGVEAHAISAHNSGLVKVVALPGFPPDALRGGEIERFEDELRRLGRAWREYNRGKGDDLSTMYLEKYAPDVS